MKKIEELLIESDKAIKHQEMDSKVILNRIKENNSRSKYTNNRMLAPLFSFMLLVFLTALIVPFSFSKRKAISNNNDNIEYFSSSESNMNIIGLASIKLFKSYDSYNNSSMKLIKNEEKISSVSSGSNKYLFSEIKITYAKKITLGSLIDEPNIDYVKDKCGIDNIEIIICDFQIKWANSDFFDEDYNTACTIVGDEGYYTIMSNDGGRSLSGNRYIFSSHIVFNDYSIDKLDDGPFYGIYVDDGYDGNYYVSFAKDDKEYLRYDDYELSTKYVYDSNEIMVVSKEVIYDMLDLDKYGVRTQKFEIVSFDLVRGIIVKNDTDEYKIVIADNTNIYKKNGEALYDGSILDGIVSKLDYIEVTYMMFDGSIPLIIYPISIVLDL